ncbi:MAG: hypothetical protein ACLPTZ_03925, partial [Beijerinckiaceae bacterium]
HYEHSRQDSVFMVRVQLPLEQMAHPALETKLDRERTPSLTEARPKLAFATAETPSSVQSSALPLRGLGQPEVRRVTALPVQ